MGRQLKPLRIGILGEIRAGKDTVADLIIRELDRNNNRGTRVLAFVTGIHDVLHLTMPEIYEDGKPRQALQHTGQALRQIKGDVWIDYLFNSKEFREAEMLEQNIIITDVRQPNEVKRLQAKGFKILKVTAPISVRMSRAMASGDSFDESDFEHETEMYVRVSPYDYLIDNSGSLEDLERKVKVITDGGSHLR